MRPRATSCQKALETCKTKAWAHAVRSACAIALGLDEQISWTCVDRKVGERLKDSGFADQTRFCKYSKARSHPDTTTLALIEQKYPGTRDAYDNGPAYSHLWLAMTDDFDFAYSRIQREWMNGVVIRHAPARGGNIEYLVVPYSIAVRNRLSAGDKFPIVDARELLQPWQSIEEHMALWNKTLPSRCTLPFGPMLGRDPIRSLRLIPAISHAQCVTLPPVASFSYEIARARIFGELRISIDAGLLVPYGFSVQDLNCIVFGSKRFMTRHSQRMVAAMKDSYPGSMP